MASSRGSAKRSWSGCSADDNILKLGLPFPLRPRCVTRHGGGFVQQNIDLDNEAQLREFFNSPASNVSTEISPDDTMYEGNRNHYFSVGHSALRCIRTAMLLSDKKGVGSILDFACGFGRVLRVLKSAFPAAELTASDVSRAAIDFCSRTLGAEPIQSSEYLEEIKINKTFDLIWVGSLLTHLEPSAFLGF